MMRILWASNSYPVYERTLKVLQELAPNGEHGTIELGEPYYSCPIRFVYSPDIRDCFHDHSAYDLILVDSDVTSLKVETPTATVSEVQTKLTDPRHLFDFLFSYKDAKSSLLP